MRLVSGRQYAAMRSIGSSGARPPYLRFGEPLNSYSPRGSTGGALSLLRTCELDDVAVRVRQVQGALAPWPVGRRGEHIYARAS
jgi:hypothetical protein